MRLFKLAVFYSEEAQSPINESLVFEFNSKLCNVEGKWFVCLFVSDLFLFLNPEV